MAFYTEPLKQGKADAKKLMTNAQMTACSGIIHIAASACAACGFIPIPVADAIPMTAAQITMVVSLAGVFKTDISETAAKTILTSVAGPLVGRALVGGVLKFIPIAGWIANSAIAFGVTEAIGWMIANDFARQYRIKTENPSNPPIVIKFGSDNDDQAEDPGKQM